METTTDYSLLQDPDMKEIFDSFLIETREIMENLDLDLVELENNPEDDDLLNKIFRSFHTIKGTSGFLGLEKLQKVTHRCEDILNKLRKGEAKLSEEVMEGILRSYDSLKELLDVIEENKNEDYDTSGIIEQLNGIIENLENGGEAEAPVEEKKPAPKKKTTRKKAAPKKTTTKKAAGKKEEPAEEKAEAPKPEPVKEEPKPAEEELVEEEHDTDEDEIEEVEIKQPEVTMQTAQQPKQEEKKTTQAKKGENTIRVDVDRLDDLLNLVQELVLGRNRLTQLNIDVGNQFEGTKISRDMSDTTRQIDLMTTELQLAVMKTRMIKIAKVFNRFPRLVRDLSKDAGKNIKLDIFGEDTELDKTLIEEINDPLVHLVRNSADHGVESPEEREAAGKNPEGTITLSAEHEGNNIIITIEDDGRGIDPEKIKSKAIEKGIITAEKAGELTRQETYNLIFAPGFSTAAKVTNVSGRGVGMDVVKTNVTKLRGIINIESEVGKGTKIIIKLPLTLAIIQGLLVNVVGETVVIPLNSVIEVVRVPKKQIYMVNHTECIKLRDTVHPLIDIDKQLYGTKSNGHDQDWQYIVIVGIAEKRFGIKVDDLIGQKEVVIKSLGNYLGNIDGLAGSTIMGDGKVVIILDIAELVHKITEEN